MALTVVSKRLPTAEPGSVDKNNGRHYEVTFEVDQTDGGALACGVAVVIAAQALGTNPVPLQGDDYSYDSFTDLDSFCQEISWSRPNPVDKPKRWHVVCKYDPVDGTDPGSISEPDPLLRPVEYWIEWAEEQVVLDEAAIVEDLSHIGRAANSVGRVVNSCGVEFTEPLMKTIYYPVLHCQKAYATLDEIVALNLTYQGTTNNGTFFGAGAREAKYLTTESGRIQRLSGTDFYMGVTRIWFKDDTWDRRPLNNGWSHFKHDGAAYELDAASNPKLFKNLVFDDPDDDEQDVPASEPLNLALNGTLRKTDEAGIYLTYRDLAEVDYAGIGIGS